LRDRRCLVRVEAGCAERAQVARIFQVKPAEEGVR
jgi:hypothetical protein